MATQLLMKVDDTDGPLRPEAEDGNPEFKPCQQQIKPKQNKKKTHQFLDLMFGFELNSIIGSWKLA